MTDLFREPRTWQRFFVGVLLLGGAWLWLSRVDVGGSTAAAPAPRVGAPAPPFTAVLVDGGPIALSDQIGQVIVLNLWATWCPPCRAEMPALERVWQRHRDEGLLVLGLNQQESAERVAAFRAEFALTFPLALDPTGEIGRRYLLTAYPTTYFIGRDGTIRDVIYGGPMPEALIESRVTALLAEE